MTSDVLSSLLGWFEARCGGGSQVKATRGAGVTAEGHEGTRGHR